MVCLAARSGVPWSDEASGERGSQEEKRPSSERTTAGSQSCKQSLLSGCVLASAEKVCVHAQSMSGGGNTEPLILTLAGSVCCTHRGLIVLQHKNPVELFDTVL